MAVSDAPIRHLGTVDCAIELISVKKIGLKQAREIVRVRVASKGQWWRSGKNAPSPRR